MCVSDPHPPLRPPSTHLLFAPIPCGRGDVGHRTDMRERAKRRSESIKKRKAQKAAEELVNEENGGDGDRQTDGNGIVVADAPAVAAGNAEVAAPTASAAPESTAGKDAQGAAAPVGTGPEPMAE